MRRGISALLIVALLVACGRYGEAEPEAPPPANAPDADADAPDVVDAASVPDVDIPDTADACDGLCSCDVDEDGELAVACGGKDCNDKDKRVRSTSDFLTDAPNAMIDAAGSNGDWNCDGKPEKKYRTGLKCVGNLGTCTDSTSDQGASLEGFLGAPPCGQSAPYYKCMVEGLSCVAKLQANVVQACK